MPPATDLEDQQLLKALAAGDRSAFERLLDRHEAAVMRLLRALLPEEAAEDGFQETFLSVFRNAGGFQGRSSVRTWILSIARNAAWRHYRRRSGEPRDLLSLEELGLAAGWGGADDPAAALERQERRRLLEKALEALPPPDRELIVLRELEQVPVREIAAMLDIGVGATKSRLHRARLRLLQSLRGGGAGHGA